MIRGAKSVSHKAFPKMRILCPVLLVLGSACGVGSARAEEVLRSPAQDSRASDPVALAARIDERLDAHFRAARVQPAPRADDEEFLRRLSLDLTGRIPRPADLYEFLADFSPDKRRAWIDRLLEEPRFSRHWANVWRAELLPELATNRATEVFQPGFEAWLQQRLRANVKFDDLVRELLSVPVSADAKTAEPVLRNPQSENPLAYFAIKEARPENLAASVTRTFLGLRLECAQCHDHPFASWKQEQFWNQAAFFAGLERQGSGTFAPLVEHRSRHAVAPGEGKDLVAAVFLDGTEPTWSQEKSPRQVYAEWLTSPQNPYFARAVANRIWGQLFGSGIVEPVDDFRDDNPPRAPALLADLAEAFVASDFDVKQLLRGICGSEAYQRTSARTDPSQDATPLPARMPVKALTGEQFFDSLALVIGYREEDDKGSARRQLVARFALAGPLSEPETSVQQALTLRNGRLVAQAPDATASPTLIAICQTPGMTTEERIAALYALVLSRRPTSAERQRVRAYLAESDPSRAPERLSDVFWALLNSAEFRVNH